MKGISKWDENIIDCRHLLNIRLKTFWNTRMYAESVFILNRVVLSSSSWFKLSAVSVTRIKSVPFSLSSDVLCIFCTWLYPILKQQLRDSIVKLSSQTFYQFPLTLFYYCNDISCLQFFTNTVITFMILHAVVCNRSEKCISSASISPLLYRKLLFYEFQNRHIKKEETRT